MLRLSSLTLRRGNKVLLDRVDMILHRGQRVGIVGPNGAGKSSFFALLRGELLPDGGDFDYPSNLVVASVRQETPALQSSALDYVLDGDAELRMVQKALAECGDDGDVIAELLGQLEAVDGYTADARASKLLAGLGFSHPDLSRPVASFSGGWRMRLNLAQALMSRSDLLLLDEPTNHLDLDAVIWLENWLSSYPGTLLLISHDRDFLDATVNAIAHLAGGRIDLYTGNYAEFEAQKAERLSQHQQAFEKQQREAAHLQKYIDRFRAQATKARQAQSRIKALERMERIAAAHVDSPFSFAFRPPVASPHMLLRLEEASAGYGGNHLLDGLDIIVEEGARIGLLGRNGAGKSTLIKLLAGDLPLSGGQRVEGKGLKIGYFAQHQLEHLRPDESAIWHLQKLDPQTREQDLRDFLGGFDFRGEMATGPVAPFSGGEKARLALAMIVWQRPNLLLLDEPTNHLDLEMRHALTLALQDYVGAMIVVSHDRHLLRATTDRFWLVGGGRAAPFDGDLDDYKRYRDQDARAANTSGGTVAPLQKTPDTGHRKSNKRAGDKQQIAELRKPLEKELSRLENQLAAMNESRAQVHAELAGEQIYEPQQSERLKDHIRKKSELDVGLVEVEERWLAVQEELEALGS